MGQRANDIENADPIGSVPVDDVDYTSGEFATGAGYDGALNGLPYSEGSPDLYATQVTSYATDADGEGDFETEGPDEIEITRVQIEQTRTELSSTIDAIQDKLAPSTLKEQAKDAVREATVGKAQDMVQNATDKAQDMVGNVTDKAQDVVGTATGSAKGFGSTLVDTIRENPIPAALTGLGLGWLIMSSRKHSSSSSSSNYSYNPGGQYDQYGYTRQQDWDDQYRGYSYDNGTGGTSGQGITDRAGNMAGQAQSAVGSVAGQAQDVAGSAVNSVQNTAGNVAGTVQDTAGQVVGQVGDTAGQLGQSAQQGYYQARSGIQRMMDQNPLAVGIMGIGLGAAIGLAIPETDKENELMGEQRDQLMGVAQSKVQGVAQKAQSVAQEAVGAAKDAAQSAAEDQGLTSAQ
jgi:uncharacterized protein YjbJ (UPF0337 family)